MYDETEKVCRGASVGVFAMEGTVFENARLDGAFLSEEQARSIKRAGGLGVPDECPIVKRISEVGLQIQIVEGEKSRIIDLSNFGHYTLKKDGKDSPLSWRLLRLERDKALIITEKPIKCQSYTNSRNDITWEKCDLRKWLNGEFLEESFLETERGMIARVCNQNSYNERFGTKGGNPTWDWVFALSIDEAKLYFRSDVDRSTGVWWWLRSPGYRSNYAAIVTSGGGIGEGGNYIDDYFGSVRPAMWLNL